MTRDSRWRWLLAVALLALPGCKDGAPPKAASPGVGAPTGAPATVETPEPTPAPSAAADPAPPERVAEVEEPAVAGEGVTEGSHCNSKSFDQLSVARQQAEIAWLDVEQAEGKAHAAEAAVDELLLESFEEIDASCVAAAVDPACLAAAQGDPGKCSAIGTAGERTECESTAALRKAVFAKDQALCGAIGDSLLMQLCKGLAGGSFGCGSLEGSTERKLCELLEADLATPCDMSGEGGAEVCRSLWLLRALRSRDLTHCGHIEREDARALCSAMVTGSPDKCRGTGRSARDCRRVLVALDLGERSFGPEGRRVLKLKAVNRFAEDATCSARITLRSGAGESVIEKELGVLKPRTAVETYRWVVDVPGPHPVPLAEIRCRWGAQGS